MADIRQVWVIETQAAEAAAKRVEEAVKASSEEAVKAAAQVDASQKEAARSAEAYGKGVARSSMNAQAAFAKATRAASAFGLGLSAATAGAEQSFVSLAATVASSFALGGPVIGGITLAAGAIGLLVGDMKDAGEEWRKQQAEMEEAQKRLTASVEESRRALLAAQRGWDAATLAIETAKAEAASARKEIGELNALIEQQNKDAEEFARRFSTPLIVTDEMRETLRLREQAMMRAEDASRRAIDLQHKHNAELEAAAILAEREAAAKMMANVPFEDLLGTSLLPDPEDTARLERWNEGLAELERRARLLLDVPFEDLRGTALLPEPEDIERLERWNAALEEQAKEDTIDRFVKGGEDWEKSIEFAARAASTVQGALSDGITDGIFEGFENSGKILEAFGRQLTQTVIDALLEATVGQATRSLFLQIGSAIFGSATPKQFGGLVTRPTVTLLGEREPERVLRDRDLAALLRAAGGGGGAPIYLSLQVEPEPLTRAGLTDDVIDRDIRFKVIKPRNVIESRGQL